MTYVTVYSLLSGLPTVGPLRALKLPTYVSIFLRERRSNRHTFAIIILLRIRIYIFGCPPALSNHVEGLLKCKMLCV